jgi:hypothetical protein
MATTDPIAAESRWILIRVPRPLWIGLAAVVLIVVAGTSLPRLQVTRL